MCGLFCASSLNAQSKTANINQHITFLVCIWCQLIVNHTNVKINNRNQTQLKVEFRLLIVEMLDIGLSRLFGS